MPSLVEIGPVVLEKKILNFVNNVFSLFLIISPWKRVGPFFWTNLNSLHPRMLFAKFCWNWLIGSGKEDFFNFVNVILFPLGKGRGPSFEKKNLIPLYPRMLCAKFGWNWPSGSGEDEHVKSLRQRQQRRQRQKQQRRRTTDKFWSENLLELSAQVSEKKSREGM